MPEIQEYLPVEGLDYTFRVIFYLLVISVFTGSKTF